MAFGRLAWTKGRINVEERNDHEIVWEKEIIVREQIHEGFMDDRGPWGMVNNG